MPYHESFETVAGCRTRIMRGGSGDPLLFLHGARGASTWLPFFETMSQSFDLIVPEHPGFGGSDTPDWLDNVGDLAYFYLDLIETLKLPRLHLAGVSLGGWIASEIAIRNQTTLRTLTLLCAAGLHLPDVAKGDIFMWSREEFTRNIFHDPKVAAAMLAQTPSDDELAIERKNRLTTAKLGWNPRLYNPDLHKWLHRITVPTLIVWGDDDKVFPLPYGEAYQKLIPGSQLEVLKDTGHTLQIERPGELAALMTRFLARN
ncbi:alpha/beta hydrolase [Pseudorhodoplanes sp.]|uniref:alpha/beta fold hydrolase n=1 Tax=Pseudorhodoplanes sp. TaxID=1934341 RepID=UPI002CE4C551|nr:alpha/beta hydrolase [Pseudorhodoplanes sp.]HWV54470.1 alpha/beta hydrolase [Pseudorhodoplanes sp.]